MGAKKVGGGKGGCVSIFLVRTSLKNQEKVSFQDVNIEKEKSKISRSAQKIFVP